MYVLEGEKGSNPRSIVRLTSLGREARKPIRKDSRRQKKGATAPEVSATERERRCLVFRLSSWLSSQPPFLLHPVITVFHDTTACYRAGIPLANLTLCNQQIVLHTQTGKLTPPFLTATRFLVASQDQTHCKKTALGSAFWARERSLASS